MLRDPAHVARRQRESRLMSYPYGAWDSDRGRFRKRTELRRHYDYGLLLSAQLSAALNDAQFPALLPALRGDKNSAPGRADRLTVLAPRAFVMEEQPEAAAARRRRDQPWVLVLPKPPEVGTIEGEERLVVVAVVRMAPVS
ncbi:hypothetical protein CSOJ01_03621 [Colletotrichum sojae]|uniref:Uncharacterized protein n=1 Tax=Colletotrichum sojae TaxID=2175907 RepID=A0A8H6JKZ3_9PEZI|nr:hypothetical protein CSOJ01_03621 [Colletotrichum sojae]